MRSWQGSGAVQRRGSLAAKPLARSPATEESRPRRPLFQPLVHASTAPSHARTSPSSSSQVLLASWLFSLSPCSETLPSAQSPFRNPLKHEADHIASLLATLSQLPFPLRMRPAPLIDTSRALQNPRALGSLSRRLPLNFSQPPLAPCIPATPASLPSLKGATHM